MRRDSYYRYLLGEWSKYLIDAPRLLSSLSTAGLMDVAETHSVVRAKSTDME